MSRSKKKHPFMSTTCIGDRAGVQKAWKSQCNKKIRYSNCDISNGSWYKKFSGDIWFSPSDGKVRVVGIFPVWKAKMK